MLKLTRNLETSALIELRENSSHLEEINSSNMLEAICNNNNNQTMTNNSGTRFMRHSITGMMTLNMMMIIGIVLYMSLGF